MASAHTHTHEHPVSLSLSLTYVSEEWGLPPTHPLRKNNKTEEWGLPSTHPSRSNNISLEEEQGVVIHSRLREESEDSTWPSYSFHFRKGMGVAIYPPLSSNKKTASVHLTHTLSLSLSYPWERGIGVAIHSSLKEE